MSASGADLCVEGAVGVLCPDTICAGQCEMCGATLVCVGAPPDGGWGDAFTDCLSLACDGPEDCLPTDRCYTFEGNFCDSIQTASGDTIVCHSDCDCPPEKPHCEKSVINGCVK